MSRSGQASPTWAVGFKHELIGDFDAGLQAARRARVIGEARADVRIITHADWLSRWLYGTRGDWEDGIRACTASLEQSRVLVVVPCQAGGLTEAEMHLKRAHPLFTDIESYFESGTSHLDLAELGRLSRRRATRSPTSQWSSRRIRAMSRCQICGACRPR